jgi:hypothetical protein
MKKRLIVASVVLWSIGVFFWCERYVGGVLASADISPGYESTWSFQVVMFLVFRMPIALLFLAGLLFVECRMLKKIR